MKKSTNKAGFRLCLDWSGAAHFLCRATLPGSSCRRSDLLGDRRAVLQELRPGDNDVISGLDAIQHGKVVADRIAQLQGRCRANVPLPSFTETNAKNWPLMRCTASTGITGPS